MPPPEVLTEPTPQHLGTRRLLRLSKTHRRRSVERQVVAHRVALDTHFASGLVLPTAAQVMAAARTQLGKPYCLANCRCTAPSSACGCRDCSGEVCFALNEANRLLGNPTNICTSSFGFAQMIRDAGLELDEQTAIHTEGTVGIRCPFCDPNSNGSNGHIVMMEGDTGIGADWTTEEGGHATGCYHGRSTGRGFTLWGYLPGVDYSKPAQLGEVDMFVQLFHPDAHGNPARPCEPPPGFEAERSVIFVSNDGQFIEIMYGASVRNDQPVDPKNPLVWRRWRPTGRPLRPGTRFTGVAFRDRNTFDPRPGGVATVSDGTTRRFYLS